MRKRLVVPVVGGLLLVAAGVYYAGPLGQEANITPATRPAAQPTTSPPAAVEGRVINAEGLPVAGARVFAEGTGATNSFVLSTHADKNGRYRIEVQEPGPYTLFSSKEDDGYALTISAFHQVSPLPVPKLNILQGQLVKDADIQLGSKASGVEGVISDDATGKPMRNAAVTLRRADNPQIYYTIGAAEEKVGGKFKALVPPGIPITIVVTEKGYETWTQKSDDVGQRVEPLILNPGETKRLTIRLRPKKVP